MNNLKRKDQLIRMAGSLFLLTWLSIIQVSAQSIPKKGSEYEIIAKDAAWCWFSDPRAVYHKGHDEKIYFAYISSKGDVMISSRDVNTLKTGTFVLHDKLQVDDHDVPSILFLPDGRILVFYTEHNGRFFMRKSKNPGDITTWEDERVISFGGKRITYSHPVMLSGEHNRIYMFWRGSDWRPSYSYSDDYGDTWAEGKAFIDTKGSKKRPYLKVVSDNKDRIDFVFTDGHPGTEPANSVYHMYYRKGIFYQTDGRRIAGTEQLPLQSEQVSKVYDAEGGKPRAWIWDIALDKNKYPVIVYTRFPSDTDHRYHYAKWTGRSWSDQEICKAGGWMPVVEEGQKVREPHYSAGIVLDHRRPDNIYLARPVNGKFEIEHRVLKGKSWRVNAITTGSAEDNMRPYVVSDSPGKYPFVIWMSGLYNHYTKFNTGLRINK